MRVSRYRTNELILGGGIFSIWGLGLFWIQNCSISGVLLGCAPPRNQRRDAGLRMAPGHRRGTSGRRPLSRSASLSSGSYAGRSAGTASCQGSGQSVKLYGRALRDPDLTLVEVEQNQRDSPCIDWHDSVVHRECCTAGKYTTTATVPDHHWPQATV